MIRYAQKYLLKGVGGQKRAKFGLHSFWMTPNQRTEQIIDYKIYNNFTSENQTITSQRRVVDCLWIFFMIGKYFLLEKKMNRPFYLQFVSVL